MKYLDNKDKVGSSFILLFSLVYLNASFEIPIHQVFSGEVFTARTLPKFLAVIAIAICLIQIFIPAKGVEEESISKAIAGFQWKPFLMLTISMLLYGLTFKFLGFSIATFLFLFVGFIILKEKRYLYSAAVSGAVVAFMWVVLTQLFDIYLDSGDIYRLLVAA
jgi:putative tricarboxylic transport membrane protein